MTSNALVVLSGRWVKAERADCIKHQTRQMHSPSTNLAEQVPTPKRRVISVGTLPELLFLRQAVLEGAGFQVFTTCDPAHAALKIQNGGGDVLLLCYSISDELRQQLVTKFRNSCPEGRVVALTNAPMPEPPVEADAFVYGIEGAEALIAAVRGEKQTF
jgi:hypothetical protein